jgi:methionyl-tRNA formyltransferase
LRLGFAASAPFGADVLERLARNHEIAFVLTQPDAAAGRGRGLRPAPAKLKAMQLGLPVVESLDDPLDAETIVLVAYGRLIPSALLERHLWLNLHPSLLPRWRGAAPVERAIMAGDEETGVTVIKLVEELDAGPIAAQRAFPVGEDAGAAYDRAAEVGTELLDEVLPNPTFTPQPDDGVTYAEKIGPDDRTLDLSDPKAAVDRVRALSPHIGARTELHGRPVTIWRARLEDGAFVPVEVQPAGGNRMSYEAFLRGIR